jgi:hypothetical protein
MENLNAHNPIVKMKIIRGNFRERRNFSPVLVVIALISLWLTPLRSMGQWVTLANPNWNITLTDYGYSDFLLDNTPGFEGREYLSGEWGAAVGYQMPGGTNVAPMWLEPQFVFPNWTTHSTFSVVTPLTQIGVNADGLPIAESVIANAQVEITLRFEMIDTVVGTPMGTRPASSTNSPTFLHSNRYVMKQTATIRNIAGASLLNVQFFQLLHGLNSQRGVLDDRFYIGPLGDFQYDTTLSGVDPWAVGVGSSSAGLEDFIGFHAMTPPSAHEIGHYGIEGNGVDDHSIGKPSDGVHLSIENNWQSAPFNTRQGMDQFAPAKLWVAGAQRWDLGNLAAGQSVSHDVILSILTGTKVSTGTNSSGGCNGGSSVPGGLDYEFESVESEGSCFGKFSRADDDELAIRVANGEFSDLTFPTPGKPAQVWEVEFNGTYSGSINLNFGYDATLLPVGFNESTLAIYHNTGGAWQKLAGTVNPVNNTISVSSGSLGAFALGVDSVTSFTVSASAAPAGSGTTTGAGTYAQGSSASLLASPNAGYVFANWTMGGTVVSTSPNLNFLVNSNLALVANFTSVGGGSNTITITSLPANGGTTSGSGAYAPGSGVTVTATPSAGYKFSKWVESGVVVSTSASYTFTMAGDRTLVAKFKPVYVVAVTAVPANGGELEVDPFYEFGELAKLKATPNDGYCFVNWTQNGVPVSTDRNFSFTVTGNRDLVGTFALGKRIDVLAEPLSAGSVSGGGVHPTGSPVTVQATTQEGYIFVNWTENGTPVSSSTSYSFNTTASRALQANFIALPRVTPSAGASGTVVVTWPVGATGWILQESAGLNPANWTNSTAPITVVDGQNRVTVNSPPGELFFRLAHP